MNLVIVISPVSALNYVGSVKSIHRTLIAVFPDHDDCRGRIGIPAVRNAGIIDIDLEVDPGFNRFAQEVAIDRESCIVHQSQQVID